MKKYKIILLSNDSGERLELQDSPIGWDATKFNIIRDFTYFGIFKSLSVEFEFVGDGFRFLQKHRLRFGVDANVLIRIYKRNKWLFDGKIHFPNFDEDRKGNRFKVDIIQSSFVQDFQNREDIKLNILNSISLDRNQITPTPHRNALFRSKIIELYSEFEGSYRGDEAVIYHHVLPFTLTVNGNPDVIQADDVELSSDIANLRIQENAIYTNTLSLPQTVKISFNINYSLQSQIPPQEFKPGVMFRLLLMNENNTVNTEIFERQFFSNPVGNYSDAGDFELSVHPGQYVVFTCEHYFRNDRTITPTFDAMIFEAMQNPSSKIGVIYNSMHMEIKQASIFPDSTHPVFLPHELFTNLVAQITGYDNAVYSEFFGRQDLGYDQDGEGAYLGITTGELLRGIPIDEVQVSTSMRDAFKSYNTVFNLGILIQRNRVIIEPKDKLINRNIAIDLGEVSNLGISAAKDFLFNSIKVGYPANEYEEENGRDEFNTTAQYTNSLSSIKNELDLVSDYYGDGYGIEFARRLSIMNSGTSDSKYDDKIFFVDMIMEEGILKTRRQEGITFISGIFSPETVINARISPGQNLLRWQQYLNIPLHRKEKVYFFQSKEKNASLHIITPLGESIDGSDLNLTKPAYFLPDLHKFNKPITIESLFALLDNPLGLIRYTYKGETFFDYLNEVDSETEKGNSQWTTLGTKPTPVDVDPDAISVNALKYGNGLNDFIKYGNGQDDFILYQ